MSYITPFTKRVAPKPTIVSDDFQVATQVLNEVDLGTIPPRPKTLTSTNQTSKPFDLKTQAKKFFDEVFTILRKPLTIAILIGSMVLYFVTQKTTFFKPKKRR